MNGTTVEEALQSSNEKESLQSKTMSGVIDSSGVEPVSTSTECNSNKENLSNELIDALSYKDSCLVDQLDISSCSFKTCEETEVLDKQGIDRINSNLEAEESEHSEATEIFIPPKEFCDADQDESNSTSEAPNIILHDNNQHHEEIDDFKHKVVKTFVLDGMSVSDFVNQYCTKDVTCKVSSHDNQIQESTIETNKEKFTSENLLEENLNENPLENPLNNSKDYIINEVIQIVSNEQIEMPQCNNNISKNNEEIETSQYTNNFGETSINNAQVDLTSVNENKLQVSQQDEKVDPFHEVKHEEINFSKRGDDNVLIQMEDECSDSSTEKILLKNENNQFEKINNDSEVNIETDNGEISKSFADSTLKELENENDPLSITTIDHTEIFVQNQFININDISVVHKDNVNDEISLKSDNNFNEKETLSIEVKDIDVTVVKECPLTNQLNIDKEQNIISTEFEPPNIVSNNEFNSLQEVECNQTQTMEKESEQDKTIVKCSEISETAIFKDVCDSLEMERNSKKNDFSVNDESLPVSEQDKTIVKCSEISETAIFKEVCDSLEMERNSKKSDFSVSDESFSVTKDEISENIEKDISESNCGSVNDNLVDSVETVLQKHEKKDLQETTNLLTSDNEPKLIPIESEEKTSESNKKMFLSEKLIEEIVTVDSVSNSILVDNSNKIEDEKSIEDKKIITKNETSLKVDQKYTSSEMDDTDNVSVQCLETQDKDSLAIENKPEVLINTLQGMKWLKSGQSNEVNQLKSLPKKNERANDNLFDGTTKKNSNRRRRSGHNKNDKANTAPYLRPSEAKSLQKPQIRTEQTKKETSPSVWNNNTAKQLFPNPNTEATVIDRIKEEEDINTALVESICTAQQESERRKMSETNLKIKILDEPDDDQWGKVRRNLPDDDKGVNQSTAKGVVDKYGRVDGYSEKHIFMGKNARRREQEFLKSQNKNESQVELAQTKPLENKSQVGPTQAKPSENKSQVRLTQTKPSEVNVAQSKSNSRSETTSKIQNAEPPKTETHEASKFQERPIHGRAGKEGTPGQVELQKPAGFNRSANKDVNQNTKQGQTFPTTQNATNIDQTHGKNQESTYRNQQTFGQQRYRYPDSLNQGIEETKIQQSCSGGHQDVKRQENISKVQSFPDRNQGNIFKNQEHSNQNESQFIKNQSNSDQKNKGQSSDQLSKGQSYSDQLNKNATTHDSLNKNQVHTDRTRTISNQNQNCLKQNHAHSDRYQGNTIQNQPNSGQNQNQIYSDKATSNIACIPDNTRHQTNLSTNQGNSSQKQVSNSVQSQNHSDKSHSQVNQINASRDQDNFGRNQNYYDKHHGNTLRNQDGYRSQDNYNRYQENYRNQGSCRNQDNYKIQESYRSQNSYRSQDGYRNQGYTDNVNKHQDSYNRVENNSDKSHGSQNYSDRTHGNRNNSDRNYNDRVQDLHNKIQNYSDNNKGNYQNQYYSDKHKDNAFKSHDNYRGNQTQDNQQKNLDGYGKNQGYGNRQQESAKQIKENQSKVPMEENWDDDQSTLKSNEQVYNQRAIKSQDSKVDYQNTTLENKKVSVDKVIGVQQTATPTSTTCRDASSSEVHLPLNPILKTVEIKPDLTNVKKVDVEPKPNIVMAFDGNANIQRALGLDRSTNYNQATISASNAVVSTTLSQLLNSSVPQSLPLTQATSQIPTNYDAAAMCAGGTMNVNAPPFNSTNFAAVPFSTDLEASFVGSPLEVSETSTPPASRMSVIANSSEEILQAHRTVSTLAKQLAAAEAKLLALNVKFYNECISSASAQNSTSIQNDGTIGEIQTQQNRLLHSLPDFVGMQHSVPQGFQVPTTGVQNVVTPVSFDASRNFATVSMQDMSNEAYQLNAAFQQRLNLQSMYISQGGLYQPQSAASYQPQPQSAANYQTQAQEAANYQQYSATLNAANRLHRGRGTPPNSEQKDSRVGAHQFYNQ